VEWKQSAKSADVLPSVCALANDLGGLGEAGYLALGVDDTGRAVGEDTSDEAVQRLANRLTSTKILPNPSCNIEVASHQGKGILVVRIAPYPVPPVVKVDGVPWIRVGTTTRRASEADLLRLNERRHEHRLPFDLRGSPTADLDDLDLALLRSEYAAAQTGDEDLDTFPRLEQWLVQRDIARRHKTTWVPTHAGLLLYGVDPQAHLPGALVELARYAGPDRDSTVVFRKTISGRLPGQLDALWSQLLANLTAVPGLAAGVRTPYVDEYPMDALKELARNMVQHRPYEGTHAPSRVSWFEDRVELSNPGGPFGQASEGELGAHSDYRNRPSRSCWSIWGTSSDWGGVSAASGRC
jgi:ATP-dependent DNA helicase RecG